MTKPTKTKEELRSLILSEIVAHPVCPAGMDVSIEATDSGGWQVENIPPKGLIAYIDCIDYIGKVAQRLRAEYDLSPEPTTSTKSPGLFTAPFGEGGFNTDAFDKSAFDGQQEPQSVTLDTSVTRSIGFSIADERGRWLKTQPNDVSIVFAARAALRVVPAITLASVRSNSRTRGRKMVLRVFRAVATAWAKAAYPGYHDTLRAAARAATFGLGDLKASLPERAAVYASAAATGGHDTSSRASTAVGYALDAAGSKDREAFEVTLKAIQADADLLGRGFSPVTIAFSQLWPNRVPEWVRDNWEELKSALLRANEDWAVWTEWYDERLTGALADQTLEVARVTMPNENWEHDPKVVNDQIKLMTEEREIFRHATDNGLGDAPDIKSIPDQVIPGSQFALDAEGHIDLVLDPPSHAPPADATQREFFDEMRHKALAVAGLGHNQLAELSLPVDRFCTALPENIENVSINRLWSRGNTLRLHLKAHEIAVASDEPVDPARLPPAVAENLRDLVETFNVFIIGDPKGRELDQVRLGPQERATAQAIVDAASPIVEAVRASAGLATPAAVEALTEQIEAARGAPANISGDQATDLSRKTASNFIAETLRVAYIEAAFAWKGIRTGAYHAMGAGGIAGVPAAYLYRQEIITFIVDNASKLKVFVEQAFHNPELIRIIDVIVQAAAKAAAAL